MLPNTTSSGFSKKKKLEVEAITKGEARAARGFNFKNDGTNGKSEKKPIQRDLSVELPAHCGCTRALKRETKEREGKGRSMGQEKGSCRKDEGAANAFESVSEIYQDEGAIGVAGVRRHPLTGRADNDMAAIACSNFHGVHEHVCARLRRVQPEAARPDTQTRRRHQSVNGRAQHSPCATRSRMIRSRWLGLCSCVAPCSAGFLPWFKASGA